jgi:hypothetical protein
MEDGELCLRAKTRPSGSSISPYIAFGGLLDQDPDLLRATPIYKHDFTLDAVRMQPARALPGGLIEGGAESPEEET